MASAEKSPKTLGKFHQLGEMLQNAIVLVAMKNALSTCQCNNSDLEHQARERQIKEELLNEKHLERRATEEYMEGIYYHLPSNVLV